MRQGEIVRQAPSLSYPFLGSLQSECKRAGIGAKGIADKLPAANCLATIQIRKLMI